MSNIPTPPRRHVSIGMPTRGNEMPNAVSDEDQAVIDELVTHPERLDLVKEVSIFRSIGARLLGTTEREWTKDDNWENAIKDGIKPGGNCHARAAYVLLSCKNIDYLQTRTIAYGSLGKLVKTVIEHAASAHLRARLNPSAATQQPDTLRFVRVIYVDGGDFHETTVESARTLLCMPALRKLTIHNMMDSAIIPGQQYVPTAPKHDKVIRNTNPISLVLGNCKLTAAGLDTLLATCPNAKALTIIWPTSAHNAWFNNADVCDVLRARGQNLERLHYDPTAVFQSRDDGHGKEIATFGSFASLKVKRLAVPKAFFNHVFVYTPEERAAQAAKLLPTGLKELYILGVADDEMASMNAIVGVDAISSLEKSVCIPWHFWEMFDLRGKLPLQKSVDYERLGDYDPW